MKSRGADDVFLGIGALLLGGLLSAVVSSLFGFGGLIPAILTVLFAVLIVAWGLRRNDRNEAAS
jgi:hypothetical protein